MSKELEFFVGGMKLTPVDARELEFFACGKCGFEAKGPPVKTLRGCPKCALPIGSVVMVEQDDGSLLCKQTRSQPFQLGQYGDVVIQLAGLPGAYLLERVRYPEPP